MQLEQMNLPSLNAEETKVLIKQMVKFYYREEMNLSGDLFKYEIGSPTIITFDSCTIANVYLNGENIEAVRNFHSSIKDFERNCRFWPLGSMIFDVDFPLTNRINNYTMYEAGEFIKMARLLADVGEI